MTLLSRKIHFNITRKQNMPENFFIFSFSATNRNFYGPDNASLWNLSNPKKVLLIPLIIKIRLRLNLDIPFWKLNLRRNFNNNTYRLLSSFHFFVSETSSLEFLLSNHTFDCTKSCCLQCIPKLKVFLNVFISNSLNRHLLRSSHLKASSLYFSALYDGVIIC